jgi:hypothetical protein
MVFAGLCLNRRYAHLDAIDHHVDIVLLGLLQCRQVVKFTGFAIDPKAHIALGLHFGKHVQELTFFLARYRRQDHQPCVLGQGQYGVHHLADGLALQGQVVLRTIGCAGAGE